MDGRTPGGVVHDSAAHDRVAALVGGPDIAEVVDVLAALEHVLWTRPGDDDSAWIAWLDRADRDG